MLNRLVQFALSQHLFMLLATALLSGFGWLSFRNLLIDSFPDVPSTQVKVIMKVLGMTPEEIESRIAAPIEVEILGIPRQQVSERLTNIQADLPSGLSVGMAPIATPLGSVRLSTATIQATRCRLCAPRPSTKPFIWTKSTADILQKVFRANSRLLIRQQVANDRSLDIERRRGFATGLCHLN